MTLGTIFAVEGPDGSGKSTAVRTVLKRLEARGLKAVTMRDPGTTPLGEKMRQLVLFDKIDLDPVEIALLFTASGRALMKAAREAARTSDIVILDRCYLSNIAYRYADGMSIDWCFAFKQYMPFDLPTSNVFYLEIPPDVAGARLAAAAGERGVDRFESKPEGYRERIIAGYEIVMRRGYMTGIDANREPATVAQDLEDLIIARHADPLKDIS